MYKHYETIDTIEWNKLKCVVSIQVLTLVQKKSNMNIFAANVDTL